MNEVSGPELLRRIRLQLFETNQPVEIGEAAIAQLEREYTQLEAELVRLRPVVAAAENVAAGAAWLEEAPPAEAGQAYVVLDRAIEALRRAVAVATVQGGGQ